MSAGDGGIDRGDVRLVYGTDGGCILPCSVRFQGMCQSFVYMVGSR